MPYVDAFIAPVPDDNKPTYVAHAHIMAKLMKEFGALHVFENWGDDIPDGTHTSLPMAVKCQPGESVVLGWAMWPSKAARDEGWAAIMADPRMAEAPQTMPFDGSRLIYGGFETVLEV